jgi:hypothetical protein
MKAVPGRKSDVRDAEWIAMLVEAAGSVGRMHGKNYLAAHGVGVYAAGSMVTVS